MCACLCVCGGGRVVSLKMWGKGQWNYEESSKGTSKYHLCRKNPLASTYILNAPFRSFKFSLGHRLRCFIPLRVRHGSGSD